MERLDLEISQCKKEIQHINFLIMSSHNRMDLIDDWEVDQLLDWTNGLNFTELVMIFLIFI